jgi:multicomponent Na+:H+ antiporter subunit E
VTTFLLNILLALVWVAVSGHFEPSNFLAGFVLAYLILWLPQSVGEKSNYFLKMFQVISFIGFFGKELFKANLRVAHDVLTPRHHMKPGVVAIPLDIKTDAEITLLANLITLTPGTLSLDISPDRSMLYVHAMYIEDIESFKREIKEGLERRIQEVLQ